MAYNRIASFLEGSPEPTEVPGAGSSFATLPVAQIPGLAEKWAELRSLYEFAYLLAQLDAEPPPNLA